MCIHECSGDQSITGEVAWVLTTVWRENGLASTSCREAHAPVTLGGGSGQLETIFNQ